MFVIILLTLITCFTLLFIFTKSKHGYWKKKNIPYLEPKPFFGNYKEYILLKKTVGEVARDICKAFPNEPYIGTFYGSDPALLVQDPDILKLVLTKDFYYFNSREISRFTHNEVTTQNLFFTYGDRWKLMRQNMTPIFTSAKMKNMFYLVENCCHGLEKLLDYEVTVSDVIETRALTARYTIESIGSCAFGVETKSMQKESKQNPFVHIGNQILDSSTYRGLKWIARVMYPSIFYKLGFKLFSTEIDKFFFELSTNIFKARNYEPTTRNDFIDCILNLKKNGYITGDKVSNSKTGGNDKVVMEVDDDLLVGMCIVFFVAGFETSSTTLSYTLYELAKDQAAQKRVQEEIDEYLKARGNKLKYDCVSSLPFTEACVDETLRLYPVLAVLTREVVEDYKLPSGLTLEKDMRVHIPVFHIHRNPAHFPDPETFRPERFLPEQKQNIKPYTYMPFGDGPRICLGMRFAKMQVLSGLVTILKKFNVELADSTPREIEYEPRAIVTMPKAGLPLKFTIRQGWEQRKTWILEKEEHNIPYLEPKPFFGNYKEYILLKKTVGEVARDICKAFPNEPYIGTFYGSDPALLVQDPDILKLVFTKDFYYFNSREISRFTHNEVTTQNLFFTYGDRWKVVRQNMTPIFTSAKMKNMFYLVENCCRGLEKLLDYEVTVSDVIETRALTARYTIESIGSCAFGVETKSMQKGSKENPFVHIGNQILDSSTYRGLKWIARVMYPSIFYKLGFKLFSTEIDKFFFELSTNIFKARNYEPTTRNDFIDCILNLKKSGYITGDKVSNSKTGANDKVVMEVDDDLLVGMCIVFFVAGFETSSTTLSYTLYELAKDQAAQKRVQEEIDEYLKARGNKLKYDCVSSLPFTEACVDETLRLYPVLSVLTREVVEDYKLPSGLTLEKDMRVHIPVFHIHRNPAHFPDPKTFRPERFLPEQKQNIKPYTYMPFGDGPRICLGMRFAKMQVLSGLVTILKKFNVELADSTPREIEYEPRAIVPMPKAGLPLKFTIRQGWEQRVLQK